MTNGPKKSDHAKVAEKPTNKAGWGRWSGVSMPTTRCQRILGAWWSFEFASLGSGSVR
jgi:hypothetical protein